MTDDRLGEQLDAVDRTMPGQGAGPPGGAAGLGALLRAYGVTERDRVTVAGRRVDDGRRCDLLVVQEGDGSWSVHAPPLGAGVRLRCDVAVSLAEWILARVPGDEGGTS